MGRSVAAGSETRRKKAFLSVLGTTILQARNPWVIAFWSAMFPGFGHLILSKFLRAYILIVWELAINVLSHVNLAILLSFLGRYEQAKELLDIRWALLYTPTYLFSIWDSYRTCVDLNHQSRLAGREDGKISTFTMNAVDINYLDKRSPLAATVWSFLSPGLGHLYNFRIPAAIFILAWWIIIVYKSNAPHAVLHSFTGAFPDAAGLLDAQWFLNIPSIYLASGYDAYVKTVEGNKLFDWEQSKFLNRQYQPGTFHMPAGLKERGGHMYIFAAFEHSIYLEEAITAVQVRGVPKEQVLAVPLDTRNESGPLFDTLHRSDSKSMLDVPMMMAALLSVLGCIYGYVLKWGPILWGLIGMAAGFGVGMLLKLFKLRRSGREADRTEAPGKRRNQKTAEVILLIECGEDLAEVVREILWKHHALGVRMLIPGSDGGAGAGSDASD